MYYKGRNRTTELNTNTGSQADMHSRYSFLLFSEPAGPGDCHHLLEDIKKTAGRKQEEQKFAELIFDLLQNKNAATQL